MPLGVSVNERDMEDGKYVRQEETNQREEEKEEEIVAQDPTWGL